MLLKKITNYPGTNILWVEKYYNTVTNKLYREDGPSYIEYNKYGSLLRERYYINDVLYREDGPAFIEYKENSISILLYYKNGKRHREDGPAEIEYSDAVTTYRYYKDGNLHREDGPAIITMNKVDVIIESLYYISNTPVDGKIIELNKILKDHDLKIMDDYTIRDVFDNVVSRYTYETFEEKVLELIK